MSIITPHNLLPVVTHEPIREYIYPVDRKTLVIKCRVAKGYSVLCHLTYWKRSDDQKSAQTLQMKLYARDDQFEYFKCRIARNEAVRYLKYYITIFYKSHEYYLTAYGVSNTIPNESAFSYLYTNENDIVNIPEWTKGAVLYQVFPERFCNGNLNNDPEDKVNWQAKPTEKNFFGGDLAGITSKINYLADLQVDVIYLNPIFTSLTNHKYDTINYFAIDPMFGSAEEFKNLVSECHQNGIKVVLDGVFNHCGYYSNLFQDVMMHGDESRYKEWFYIESFPINDQDLNYECVGDYKWMPKLRFKHQEVREYFLNVGAYWIEQFDIDGWRLDVCDEVDYTFWQEFRRKIKSIKKDAVLIGEIWGDARNWLQGDQLDSVMNYLFRDAVVDYIAKESITSVEFDYRIQKMYDLYPETVNLGLFNLIGSHDTERFLTLCNGDILKLKLAAIMQMTLPGMPAIYYGDEIGMMGHNDPDCRRTMAWESLNQALLQFYRTYLKLRRTRISLIKGSFKSVVANEKAFGYVRKYRNEITYVIINRSKEEEEIKIPLIEDNSSKDYVSLVNGKHYAVNKINDQYEWYNHDIHAYQSSIEVLVPSYQFDMITIKEETK